MDYCAYYSEKFGSETKAFAWVAAGNYFAPAGPTARRAYVEYVDALHRHNACCPFRDRLGTVFLRTFQRMIHQLSNTEMGERRTGSAQRNISSSTLPA